MTDKIDRPAAPDQSADVGHRPDQEAKRGVGAVLARVLRHPLTTTLIVIALGTWLIPSWLQRSQVRQSELTVKSGIVDQIASDTTTSVRAAITRASPGAPQVSDVALKSVYFTAVQQWLVERALIRAKFATYFPALEPAWYTYSDVVTSFLSIPQPDIASAGYVNQIKSYVATTDASECGPGSSRNFDTERFCNLRAKINWDALSNQKQQGFAGAYGNLGELLLIYKDRFTTDVNNATPSGYHTSWPF